MVSNLYGIFCLNVRRPMTEEFDKENSMFVQVVVLILSFSCISSGHTQDIRKLGKVVLVRKVLPSAYILNQI